MEHWRFENSMPKFFISKVKSKEEILERIGLIEEFIEEHTKIFKLAKKLKVLEKQVRPKLEKPKRRRRRKISYTRINGKRVRVVRS